MYYESHACARSLFSILPPAETIIIILIGILMALYSMTTKTQSALQGIVRDFFMAQVATVTILI